MQSSTGPVSTYQAQPGQLHLSEAERDLHQRLLKLAPEIDRFEGYTRAHATEVARLAERLGAAAGLHGTDLVAVRFAALAHDLGERTMKRNYLLRPDALTWEETLDLWRHPIIGEQQAAELKLPRQAQLLIRWHHEWWNGRGYPDGLTGEAIPLSARILRAADTYCALIADRPYRAAFNPLDAEQIIADGAGIEFDPNIAKLLLLLLAEDRRELATQSFPASSSAPAYEDAPPPLPELVTLPVTTEAQAMADTREAPEITEAMPPDTSPAEVVAEKPAEHTSLQPAPEVEPSAVQSFSAPTKPATEELEPLPRAVPTLGDETQSSSRFEPATDSPLEPDTEEFERVPRVEETPSESSALDQEVVRDEQPGTMQQAGEQAEEKKDGARFYQ